MAKLIGTAGHVDHGKTTLIRALTGIDADRLPEEKSRGMTIDIGFAYADLPGVGRVSIVDVPGHQRFLTNMLVGALGIDVGLLCVAADESVMPQTREHLQRLELLPVDSLVVALTRVDLADADTREIARLEVEELIASSRFGSAPIVQVSATTGEGLEQLRASLVEKLESAGEDSDDAAWYLPMDRAFSVRGHGVVVTGTLARGAVRVGDEAILEPGHVPVRVRGIHVHGEAVEGSERGKRTALNLSGVKLGDVHRGMALGAPGALFETRVLDAKVRWVGDHRHGQSVRASIGSAEAVGKLFLSDSDPAIAQLRLDSPVACAMGQPLILRRYSPPDLIAGGRVVVPIARTRRKTEKLEVVQESDLPSAILQIVGDRESGLPTEEICRLLGRAPQALGDVFAGLLAQGKLLSFAGLWMSPDGFGAGSARFLAALDRLHEKNPTQASVARERVVQEAVLVWAGKPLDRIVSYLAAEGKIDISGTAVRSASFRVQLSPRQREFLDRVVRVLESEPVNTPPPHEIARAVVAPPQAVEEVLKLGIQAGEVAQIGDGIFYTPSQIESLKRQVSEVAGGKPFAASAVRDALGTTRRYAIPLLEYFDSIRFTTRVGDQRMING